MTAEYKYSLVAGGYVSIIDDEDLLRSSSSSSSLRMTIRGINIKIDLDQCQRYCMENGIDFDRQSYENMAWSQQVNVPMNLMQNVSADLVGQLQEVRISQPPSYAECVTKPEETKNTKK